MATRIFVNRALFSVCAASLLLAGCKKDDENPGGTTDDTNTVPADPMARFDGKWSGVATRSDGIEIDSSVDLTFDAAAQEATGQLDLDGLWDIVITPDGEGTYVAVGTPLFGDDTLDITAIDFADDSTWTGNWLWDFQRNTYEGSLEMTKGGAAE